LSTERVYKVSNFFLFVNMCSYVCQKILSTYFIPIKKSSLTLTYKQLIFNILHICNYYQGDLTHFKGELEVGRVWFRTFEYCPIIIYFHLSQCRPIPYLHQRPIFFKTNSSIVAILELIRGAQCLIEVPKVVPIRVIRKLPNSEQSNKGKVKTHKCINRQNQSTTGKLWKP
jgi:hypothetical protein